MKWEDPQVIASMIAAATALVAVVIGPFIALRASKSQLLGPMRQVWINDLRNTLAEFCARVSLGYEAVASTSSLDDMVRHEALALRTTHIQETKQLLAKIVLLINPKEIEHKELVRLARAAYVAYMNRDDRTNLLNALQECAQIVLKKEWDVVKR